jgi:hypothetical protein
VEQQFALFQHQPWPEENIRLSVCREKTQAWGLVELVLMQAMKSGFRGLTCAFWLG